jgi:hypothetical protein
MERLRRLCRYSQDGHFGFSVVSGVNKKDPSFGRKAEARRSGNYRDSDSCFGSKVRLNTASCGVLALIDMTICVTPQQRLIGRALYSHLREAIHTAARKKTRLLRRFAARHDVESAYDFVLRARRRRSPDGRSTIRDGDTDEGHGFRFAQSGATSASPRLCESCLAIPLIIQDDRPLDEARGFLIPSMLFAPFRPRTSHVMGFGSVLADRTSPQRVQKIWNGLAQSCPHPVERKSARRMQTHQSLLSLRQWLSARPRS